MRIFSATLCPGKAVSHVLPLSMASAMAELGHEVVSTIANNWRWFREGKNVNLSNLYLIVNTYWLNTCIINYLIRLIVYHPASDYC